MDDLVLLHENDSHYNLIISKNSDLAKLGGLSYRLKIIGSDDDNKSVKDDVSRTQLKLQLKNRTEHRNNQTKYSFGSLMLWSGGSYNLSVNIL